MVVKEQTMTRDLRILLVIPLSVVTLAFAVANKPAAMAQGPEEIAVREALLKSASTFEKNDLAEATKVWVNDDSLTVFESGHANYGRADYRDNHLGPEMREMQNTKYRFSEIKIHMAGRTAWATFKYTISADATSNGQQRHVDGGGLGTAILENRDGQWRIVHWHSSTERHSPAATPSPAVKP
jgi:ketosteroid isomerase-like protein